MARKPKPGDARPIPDLGRGWLATAQSIWSLEMMLRGMILEWRSISKAEPVPE